MKKSPHTVTVCGLLTALALIFSYIELLIPISIGIPGIKLGFANILIVYTVYKLGPGYAAVINICRILLGGILFGSVYSTLYALAGGVLSVMGMILLFKADIFSVCGVSMAGGVLHNLGQLAVAAFMVKTRQLFLYFPVLVFSGIAAGIFNGIISSVCLRKTEKLTIKL